MYGFEALKHELSGYYSFRLSKKGGVIRLIVSEGKSDEEINLEYNNITNKDFANRIGITPKHLIDILSGERDISSSIVEKISLVTDIPADYIYIE